MARHPGTPVGDLFPPGVAIFGAGGGQGQQALPPASSQVMSPRCRDYPPARESRGRTPPRGYGGAGPAYPQELLGRSINMIGQFIQIRRGDEEATAARITYELEESTASAVREAQLQQEYNAAAAQLAAELSAGASQQLQYMEHEQRMHAEARIRTIESALGSEYQQTQANLQQQYLQQVQEVNAELQASHWKYEDAIRHESRVHADELDKLRRELAEKQRLIEEQASDLRTGVRQQKSLGEQHSELLSAERGRFQENLALQAQKWKEYSESITEDAEAALLSSRAERDEAETEIDHLSSALIDARTELEEWDEWYASHYPPEGVREQELLEEPPQVCPSTPPVVQSTIPSEFLPPPRPRSFAEPRARAEEGGMDAPRVAPGQPSSSAFPTFAPTTPQQLMQPSMVTSAAGTPSPSTPGNPWASTRERLQMPLGMDVHSCPTSAGISDASTLPMQRPPINPPGLASQPSAPSIYACPAMGQSGYPQQSHPPQPGMHNSGGRTPQDEVRKDRSPIPKLAIKGGDSTSLTRQMNEWIQKTTIALNTWSQAAASFWVQVVNLARQQHNWWLSLSPAERATHLGLPTTGQTIPLQLPLLEATMRAELLNGVLPERVITSAMQKGNTTILDLLFLTFQTYLPSEPSARVDGLTAIEAPLRAARNFQDALSTLRTWRQQVLTVVTDLGGNPEPLKLLSSLKTLISSLVSSDNAFATEVAQMYRTTNVKVHCTDSALLQMMGLLEIELSARAQEDDEEKRRKGQTHHVSTASAEARGASKGKGKGKGKPPQPPNKGKGKKDDNKGKGKGGGDDTKPICSDYLTDNGCPRGDQCTYRHPARVGKCLRCGSTGHQLSTCRRPRRDATPKAAAKSTAGAKARAKSKGKPKPKTAPKKGANAAWAEGVDQGTTVTIEELDEDVALLTEVGYSACSFFTSFLPTFHSTAAEASAASPESLERAPILDSGATHCLLPLTWLSEEDTEKAKRIHLRVASGDQVRALLYNNIIYAKSVTRPLVSIGQLKSMIDLRFVWDDGAPVLLFCSDGRKYILLKAKVVHHLPLITTEELAVLLSAINACTTTGTLWDRQQWSQQLGRDFTTYGNSDVESAYPPVTTAPPVDASDNEAQTVEVSQFPTSATVAQPSAQMNH